MAFLDDIYERLRGEGALTPERVVEILRAEWGGTRQYIGGKPPKPSISAHDTPSSVQQKHKIPRSTAYNWVSRWK